MVKHRYKTDIPGALGAPIRNSSRFSEHRSLKRPGGPFLRNQQPHPLPNPSPRDRSTRRRIRRFAERHPLPRPTSRIVAAKRKRRPPRRSGRQLTDVMKSRGAPAINRFLPRGARKKAGPPPGRKKPAAGREGGGPEAALTKRPRHTRVTYAAEPRARRFSESRARASCAFSLFQLGLYPRLSAGNAGLLAAAASPEYINDRSRAPGDERLCPCFFPAAAPRVRRRVIKARARQKGPRRQGEAAFGPSGGGGAADLSACSDKPASPRTRESRFIYGAERSMPAPFCRRAAATLFGRARIASRILAFSDDGD